MKKRHVWENASCQKLAKTNKNQHFSIFDSSDTVHYKCMFMEMWKKKEDQK